jgi:S-DNA-T family DNA segregation ATPase FtsK/SpoIIIE
MVPSNSYRRPPLDLFGASFRDVLASKEWLAHEERMPLVLGWNPSGKALLPDLAEIGPLLITGPTGAGKSACLHNLLLGLLHRFNPEELHLLLIDSTGIEFSPYQGIPHLVGNVVTHPSQAERAFDWAIEEAERRHRLLSSPHPGRLPRLLVVIDELAPVGWHGMDALGKLIARLCFVSQGADVHLLATTNLRGRPLTDAGRIWEGFRARLTLQEGTARSSRTAKGRFAFVPDRLGRLVSGQAAFVSEEEIQRVTAFISGQATRFPKEAHPGFGPAQSQKAKMTPEMMELVFLSLVVIREEKKACAAILQHRLGVGHGEAIWALDVLERHGVLGPERGTQPRAILVDLDSLDPGLLLDEAGK